MIDPQSRPSVGIDLFFPSCHRLDTPCIVPDAAFPERWKAKRDDFVCFVKTYEMVCRLLLEYGLLELPSALIHDWQARWAANVFWYSLPKHNSCDRQKTPGWVETVGALVEAINFVHPRCSSPDARRFWAYVLPNDHYLDRIPTLDWVQRHRPDLDPRAGFPDFKTYPPECSRYGHFDQEIFFNSFNEILAIHHVREDLCSLRIARMIRRLTYATAEEDLIWHKGVPLTRWANDLRCSLPILSAFLKLECDPRIVDEQTSLSVLLTLSHNWYLKARQAVLAQFSPQIVTLASPVETETERGMIEPVAHPNAPQEVEPEPVGTVGKTRKRKLNINARMLNILSKDPEAYWWSASAWKEKLKCGSAASIKSCQAWQQIRTFRVIHAAEKVSRTGITAGRKGRRSNTT
jgi:hypothetical protein